LLQKFKIVANISERKSELPLIKNRPALQGTLLFIAEKCKDQKFFTWSSLCPSSLLIPVTTGSAP